PRFGIFEVGRVVEGIDENNLCIEKKKLAITLYSKVTPIAALFFKLRDILEVMSDELKHKPLTFEPIEATSNYQHPRNLNKIICDGVEIGQIGIVHPTVQKKIDKKAAVVFAEIDVEAFAHIKNASINYVEPSKFPEMEIDLSFVANKFAPIAKAIADAHSPLIKNVDVTDVYEDENDGTKSITTRITFAHPDKTLTREEVQEVTDGIIESLKKIGIALKG
ncbi:MAG: phenylalanine--tRNA ligase subunit beta, partial [Clostridia bacterium]|nr:phenylalanine--tRNA ligase subunit beta [Clostridia bacterium]